MASITVAQIKNGNIEKEPKQTRKVNENPDKR